MFRTRITIRQLVAVRRNPSHLFPRPIHTTLAPLVERPPRPTPQNAETSSHTAESYFIDVDETLPPDPTTLSVDAASDDVQRPYDPPTGPWSRAGAETEEYRTMSREEPYDVANGEEEKMRYGGRKRWAEDKGPETSQEGEGPEGSGRFGRKPEGRG